MATPPAEEPSHDRGVSLNYTDGLPRFWDFGVSALVEGAASLGIQLSDSQLARLDQLGAALREGNRRMNLTRITDAAEVETRHFLDSLSAAVPLLDRLNSGET